MVTKINESEFDAIQNDEFAVVDFSAQWCGPCKMLGPIVEELSNEYNEKIKFYNVDVDECPNLAQQFGIASIPFVAIFKKGELVQKNIGFVPKDAMKKFIDAAI